MVHTAYRYIYKQDTQEKAYISLLP